MQKKAYRVLEEVCAAPHAPCQAFVRSHLPDLQAALLDSLKSAASPAKRVRARAAAAELGPCQEGTGSGQLGVCPWAYQRWAVSFPSPG